MPFKQDPLPKEKIAIVERWVTEGAKYDGDSPGEDWTILLRKTQQVTIPAAYPVTVPITALEFSRDGSAIAASGYHEITFWKTADGTLDRRLTGLAERVYDIAYSPDGKWLATASGDPGVYGVAKLWIAEPGGGGKPVRDLAETQDVVFAVAFSPDSKKIATAGADRTIRVFEVETGKLLTQIEDHADWIFGIAFSPDGKRLASASRDKTCKVFDLEKKESLVTFPGHAQPVYTVSFTPDGKGVATGGEDNRIRIWNPDNDGKSIREIGGFGGTVFKLRYSPDGKNLVAAGGDKTVHVFDAKGSRLRKLQGTQRLDLCPGDLTRQQDRGFGKLGRRGQALEPGRRQAAEDHHRRARVQGGRGSDRGEVSRMTARDDDLRLVNAALSRRIRSFMFESASHEQLVGSPPHPRPADTTRRRAGRGLARLDPQAVIHRGQQVAGRDGAIGGRGGMSVAGADDLPAANAAAGQDDAPDARPVVAAARRIEPRAFGQIHRRRPPGSFPVDHAAPDRRSKP